MKTKKNSGSLNIEFALLIPVIMTIFLALLGTLYSVSIAAKIERSVSKAIEDLSGEIFIASLMLEDTEAMSVFDPLNSQVKEFTGIEVDSGGFINKQILKQRIKSKTYKYMGFKNKPVWLKKDLSFELSCISNTLKVKTKAKIRLPVLSKIFGDIKFVQNQSQAARGINKILNPANNGSDEEDNSDTVSISICKYSYSGANSSPVYHDKKCKGRKFENTANTIQIEIKKSEIKSDGTFTYKGKTYRYCKFCKKME